MLVNEDERLLVYDRIYKGESYQRIPLRHYIYPIFIIVEHKGCMSLWLDCIVNCKNHPDKSLKFLKEVKQKFNSESFINNLNKYDSRDVHNVFELFNFLNKLLDIAIYLEENKLTSGNKFWNTDIFLLIIKFKQIKDMDFLQYLPIYIDFILTGKIRNNEYDK